MKPIENKIKYYGLLMSYDDTSKYNSFELPEGYHYDFYSDGDEGSWVDINLSSGLISNETKAHQYFHQFFDSFIDRLHERCIFIVDDNTNKRIATVTISLLNKDEYGYNAAVDWFSIKKEYQGKKLSKPLINRFIKLANDLGHDKIILHTQTITPLAAKLYLDLGFEPLNLNDIVGWKVLKRITNHNKLSNIEEANDEEMYDRRNIKIEQKLDEIYGQDNYNYSVLYNNGLHKVYVYSCGKSDEYDFYEEEDINLVKKL